MQSYCRILRYIPTCYTYGVGLSQFLLNYMLKARTFDAYLGVALLALCLSYTHTQRYIYIHKRLKIMYILKVIIISQSNMGHWSQIGHEPIEINYFCWMNERYAHMQ